MNLRKVGDYNIGLDIGPASVGWSVTDALGRLCHFRGKPTWGSRVFPSAMTASKTRMRRSQRRRYNRRRWRLDLLQGIFEEEVSKVDPEFFIRLRQSSLFSEDRDSAHAGYVFTLFNSDGFDERDYFKKFPTVYHLRKWLMTTEEKADIRLIYLAMHNIVKHRGNFLQQDNQSLTSQSADIKESVALFCGKLQEYCDDLEIPCNAVDNEDAIVKALKDTQSSRSAVQKNVVPLLGIKPCMLLEKPANAKGMAKALAASLVGLSTDVGKIFYLVDEVPEGAPKKLYLSNDEQVTAFEDVCVDDALSLFESMKAVYSAYVLQEILSSAPGESLSANKVRDYERYGEELKLLKALVREYAPKEYSSFFRGAFYPATELHPQKKIYDRSKLDGYTKYNEVRKSTYEEFFKATKKLFEGTGALDDIRYKNMIEDFENKRFLRRLKTSDNGAIPFQLNLEELDAIIERQSAFYPFLASDKEKLDSLVKFRIPYYVGPLTQKNARKAGDKDDGDLRFAWAERLDGKENEKVYPWNWEDIIDKDASAEKFIRRMTGACTYLSGEPVLPKCSLLYEEFCMLNELNGARFSLDGDSWKRFDYKDRSDIVEDLFKKKRVAYKDIVEWMQRERNHAHVHVKGAQGELGFESKLGSYIFFAKDVFEIDELPESYYPMLEEIILWSTLFEDRSIFKEKLKKKYGDRLTDEQIDKIVKKRFSGWGRLSEKLLAGLKVETNSGSKSVIEVLREGNPNNHGLSRPMVLMEILTDDHLGFQDKINAINIERIEDANRVSLEELPGSPALRRSVNQALAVVEEIVHIAGHAPSNIFIEVTRNDDMRKKGHRTKRRYDSLTEALEALKNQSPNLWDPTVSKELSERSKDRANLDERITLYFMQGGKSLYSGTSLDINTLSKYEVDHIIPRSYIKDDSFENKALVLKGENQAKSDQMLIPGDVRKKMRGYWRALHDAKLIGDKKFNNLMRSEIEDRQMKGFISRQLVETSQIVKTIQYILSDRYQDTRVFPVKAFLSSELRNYGQYKTGDALLPKCREVNDFHHAHDALLASEIGRFILKRHEGMYLNPIAHTHVMREFVKKESELSRQGHAPGRASFIVRSFMQSGFDEKTGELVKDDWSASEEIERLKRYFNYRQCFISRMPEETSGSFWDETIYSPRDRSKLMNLPLKKGLDPKKYGSYSREQFAYFFIYKTIKKDKTTLVFAPVPVRLAPLFCSDEAALVEYASALAREDGAEFQEIVRSKIYKYQLIDVDGSRLYVTGKSEVRNAVAVALDVEETRLVNRIVSGEGITSEQAKLLFERIRDSLIRYSPKLSSALNLDQIAEKLRDVSQKDKEHVIMELFAIAAGKKNMINLACVGGSKCAGQLKITFSKELNVGSGISIIDQSVTGMFEARKNIGV